MKINEGCIEHNVVRIVSDLVDSRYEFINADTEQQNRASREYMIMTLGEIGGVLALAEELKKVLKE